MRSLAGIIELAATAISLRTLLRAQSLRGHNGTVGPPPNLRWTLSVASGMLGSAWLSGSSLYAPWNLWQAMAQRRSLRQFLLGSGIFVVAIAVVVLLVSHDLFAFLAVPVVTALLILLEARRKLSES